MPVGFGPYLSLERKQEKKVGAVIVLAAEESKELEGVCHGVGHVFSSLAQTSSSVLMEKEQLSVAEM